MDLVIEKKREAYFHNISLVYQDVYRKAHNIVIGKLTTAMPVEAQEEGRMKKIVADMTHGNVDFQSTTNPDILGGFILQVGTYQLDASISSQLKSIKDQLLKKNSNEA